jgi:hypothetical protein
LSSNDDLDDEMNNSADEKSEEQISDSAGVKF